MAIYDTYKEAVLANGSTDGVHENLRGGEFQFGFLEPGRWKICNPADYLETLESFLASGKRLVNGDRYVEDDGEVMLVSRHGSDDSVPEDSANRPMKRDDRRFILQSAADQVETPEEKEAFDRIPNQDTTDAMNSEAEKESYNSASEAFDAIDTTPQQVESLSCSGKLHDSAFLVEADGFNLCDDIKEYVGESCVIHYQFTNSKGYEICAVEFEGGYCHCVVVQCLETAFEREERERLEAAYQLYCKSLKKAYGEAPVGFANWQEAEAINLWLAIVDETGYRKQ